MKTRAGIFLALFLAAPSTAAPGGSADVASTAGVLKSTGAVQVDVATGRVDARVCLTNRPAAQAGAFALNAGLNVARVTDGDGKPVSFDGWYEPGIDGEARVYTVAAAPPTLCVEYVGAFPVYPAHDAIGDFKGVMAFNGDSARFAEQSAWLPIPFDKRSGARLGETAYDLDVACRGCRFLYVNGSPVFVGRRTRFFSAIARPPLLFAGTGPITRTPHVTIVNETVSPADAGALSDMVGRLAGYYRDYMGSPVADRPTFLRMVTIDQAERDRVGSEWGFATWPTIAMSGSVGKVGATLLPGQDRRDRQIAYLAHEMAHYYFGPLNVAPTPFFAFMTESTAEFLAIKALGHVDGEAAVGTQVARLARELGESGETFVALDKVSGPSDIGGLYRYNYGPLLLLALERHVGAERMREFMRNLASAGIVRSWADLSGVASRSGIDDAAWERWRRTCVDGAKLTC